MKDSVAVIGGGLSGLTAAYELAKSGFNITIFEKKDHLGGRSYPFEKDGCTVDAGAQLFGINYTSTLGLIKELGLDNELIELKEPTASIFSEGRFYPLSFTGLIKYNKLSLKDKFDLIRLFKKVRDLGKIYSLNFSNAKVNNSFPHQSIADWTLEHFNENILEYFIQPTLTALTLAPPEKIPVGYGLTLLYSDLGPSLVLEKGVSYLTATLEEKLIEMGVSIQKEFEVVQVRLDSSGKEIEVQNKGKKEAIQYEKVICSTTAEATARILSFLPSGLKKSLSEIGYSKGYQVVVKLQDRIWNETWGILFPRKEFPGIAMISESELKSSFSSPNEKGLFEVFLYGDLSDNVTAEEISDHTKSHLERIFPGISGKIKWIEVLKWKQVIPLHSDPHNLTSSISENLPQGVYITGDYLYLPSVEGAITSGFAAARSIINSNS